jgi:hypothetical protein
MRVQWIAALTAVTLVGCGGSDEPLTHDEFVSKADKICAEYQDKINDVFTGLAPDAGEEERNDTLERYVDVYTDMTDEITDLEAPSNDDAIVRYLDRLKRNARGFEKAADEGELMSDDTGSAVFNSQMEELDLAEAAGMRECSTMEY